MPVWYERTKPLETAGQIRTVGLIQEQHPERCRLFMQWKQMDFPVLVDSLNLLDVSAVPITMLIDETGVIKAIRPDEKQLAAFVAEPAIQVSGPMPAPAAQDELDVANRLLLLGDADDRDRAIHTYEQRCGNVPDDARAHFRLGVALRRRFDDPVARQPGDFTRSVEHWQRALALKPNQYIWRRRIQQYGPRLDKPYPFYDWVDSAQRDIRARGEEPVVLAVDLSGAEIARPQRATDARDALRQVEALEPDPDGKIDRDQQHLLGIEPVLVPDTGRAKRAVRVHVLFTPSAVAGAKWNDEAGPSVVWIDPPDGWSVEHRLLTLAPPTTAGGSGDSAIRTIEFEAARDETSESAEGNHLANGTTVHGYALYNICFGPDGACTYVRQDFAIAIESGE